MKYLDIEQAVMDLRSFNADGTAELLEWIKKHRGLAVKANEQYKAHCYPEDKLTYHKAEHNILLPRMSSTAREVLDLLVNVMTESNRVKVSSRDIARILNIRPNTVNKAINELIEQGCLAVEVKASGRKAPVYMINPRIASIGRTMTSNGIDAFNKIAQHPFNCVKTVNHTERKNIYDKKLNISYVELKPKEKTDAVEATPAKENNSKKQSF